MIKLYLPTQTSFLTNGIGVLHPIHCKVTEELNGEYELYMEISINAAHYSDITMRSIILAKPNPYTESQPFRVYRITKPFNGIVAVYARHIAYDLSGIVVTPYEAADIATALRGFSTYAVTPSPFDFITTRTTAATFSVNVPSAVWSLMGGQAGSILDVYGGEYDFDGYEINLLNRRGSDRGVSVRYGKNMTDLEQDTNCSNCYTGVIAYWSSEESTVYGNAINAEGAFDYTRILPIDASEDFDTAPSVEQLDVYAQKYIESNDIGVPTVSWKVEFVPLEKTAEYANIQNLERIWLGDTVSVYFEKLGVNASSRVVKTEYDVLADKYISVTLGRVKSNLADTIVAQQQEIEKRPTKTLTERIIESLNKSVLGAAGGAVRLIDTDGDGTPDELYIADNADPSLAIKVWRFNYAGWAASENGYDGDFKMGATIENGFLADFITAANLKAGIIQSADGKSFYLNLDSGVLEMDATNISLNGNNFGDFLKFEFDSEGRPILQLGYSGNNILLKLQSDRISFYSADGTSELAYWNDNSFRLVSLQSFQLGKMKIVTQPNGSVSFLRGDS